MGDFFQVLLSPIPATIGGLIAITALLGTLEALVTRCRDKEASRRIVELEAKAEKAPEKAKPAWDLAREKLELYLDRNLSQINCIFWLSVIVMTVGFGLILYGMSQTLIPLPVQSANAVQPTAVAPAVVGSIAGIITEFVGATFLFIYRSTIQQALTYTKMLERINSVGMAIQILDTIPTNAKDDSLKNTTKATVVKVLMQQSYEDQLL